MSEMLPSTPDQLVERWVATSQTEATRLPARLLYKGAGWSYIKQADACTKDCSFFVASAGFGLQSINDCLPPYEASFAPGADRVAEKLRGIGSIAAKHRIWWHCLNHRLHEDPHPVASLAGNPVVVVAGRDYLEAMSEDLARLADQVGPHGLLILSGATNALPGSLERCRLCVREGFGLGGARVTANARALLWLVQSAVPAVGWNFAELRARFERDVSSATRQPRSIGLAMTDEQLETMISEELARDPLRSKSSLLCQLRNSGRACEQHRFSQIFKAVSTRRKK